MSRRQPAVNFRLDVENYRELARKADGKSANLRAREILVRALFEEAVEARVDGRMREFDAQLRGLRRDLRVIAQTILHLTGKASPEEARRWVEKYFPDQS